MGIKGKKKKGQPSPLNASKEGNVRGKMSVEPSSSPSEEASTLLLTSQELTEIVGAAVEERFVSQNLLSSQELADIARVALEKNLSDGAEGEEVNLAQNRLPSPRAGGNGTRAGQNHNQSSGGSRDRTTSVQVRDQIDGCREEAVQLVPSTSTVGIHGVLPGLTIFPEEASCEAHQNARDDGGGGIRRRLKVPREAYNGDWSRFLWTAVSQYLTEEFIKSPDGHALSFIAVCLVFGYLSRWLLSCLYLNYLPGCCCLLFSICSSDVYYAGCILSALLGSFLCHYTCWSTTIDMIGYFVCCSACCALMFGWILMQLVLEENSIKLPVPCLLSHWLPILAAHRVLLLVYLLFGGLFGIVKISSHSSISYLCEALVSVPEVTHIVSLFGAGADVNLHK